MTDPIWSARNNECEVRVEVQPGPPRRLSATVTLPREKHSGWNQIPDSLSGSDLTTAARLFGAVFVRRLVDWQVIDLRRIPGEWTAAEGNAS